MNNDFDRRERTVFVSMIHKSINDDRLYDLMSKARPIEKVIFKENPDGTLLHALVIFRNIQSVVFSMLHLQPLMGNSKLVQIRPLRESSHRTSPWCYSHLSRKELSKDGAFQQNKDQPKSALNAGRDCCAANMIDLHLNSSLKSAQGEPYPIITSGRGTPSLHPPSVHNPMVQSTAQASTNSSPPVATRFYRNF
ncbi:unnamed protein product [Cylicocyclus nassatus]|uniref:RRM domain-containing protein n=1 Tax=Cylicocyclus nassatus TaxID=53992 RepID=A0AA36GG75_CYLNA|nr:unnamed protein product [Cylicocyclus nassatus]